MKLVRFSSTPKGTKSHITQIRCFNIVQHAEMDLYVNAVNQVYC